MSKKLIPFINIGPGLIIKRNLEALNWTNQDLADIINMSDKSISLIINNKQSITVETARLLGKAFDTSPEFWLNLDQNYRLRNQEEGKAEEETQQKAEIRKYMPMLEMRKKGWIKFERSIDSQITAYKKFWGQNFLDFSHFTISPLLLTRQSKVDENYTKYYTTAWLRKVKSESSKIIVPAYNHDSLLTVLNSFTNYTIRKNGINDFIEDIMKCGVKFLIVSHLQKTFLDGAAFYDGENPVLVYTCRYDKVDNFWWTIAHELGHIVKHLQDTCKCFIDNLDEKSVDIQELEADDYAAELLQVNDIKEKASFYKNYFTELRLLEIADSLKIHPSVVIGILQFNKIIDYRTLTKYKKTVRDTIDPKFLKG